MSTTNSSSATMTVTETANVLGISGSSAYERVRLGAIPSIRLGRRMVVLRQAVRELLDAASVRSTTPTG